MRHLEANRISGSVDAKSKQVLEKFKTAELKLANRLARKDSLTGHSLVQEIEDKYATLEKQLSNPGKPPYIPSLDTFTSSLHFIKDNLKFLQASNENSRKLTDALGNVTELSTELAKAEKIKSFIKERKDLLQSRFKDALPLKQLQKLNKQAYYYSAQLKEYKSMLQDHNKVETKALELLSRSKLFKNFMQKHSQLASLFRMPQSGPDPSMVSFAGLQTRTQVSSLMQQQLVAGGSGGMAQFQANMQEAKNQLQAIKDKLVKAGGTYDEDMAEGFKPNSQKVKRFLKRFELGTNMQSQKSSGLLPGTTDIGLSIGYKLNDKSVLGIGAAYKVGFGRDIRHLKISHEGIGLRSFLDWKIKKSFWVSGGYEMYYRAGFKTIEELKNLNAWQTSGLLGISKVVSLKTKVLKKTKVQLLWDFLSYQQVPVTQPILFRIGYSF